MKADSDGGSANLERLTEKQIQMLRRRLKQFKDIFEDQQSKFLTSSDSDYYIVSRQYINDWLDYCQVSDPDQEREPLKPLNYDIVDSEGQLRPGLVETQDFQIVTEAIYNLIKQEKGTAIHRKSVIINDEKKVPIYLDTIKYVKLDHKDIRAIDIKQMVLPDSALKNLPFSVLYSVETLIEAIKKNESSRVKKVRLWRNNVEEMPLSKLQAYIKEKAKHCMTTYRIDGVGKLIESEKIKVEDLNLSEKDYFIAQFADQFSTFFFKCSDQAKCQSCFKYKKLSFICGCKLVAYCSEECQERDKRYHMKECKFAEDQQMNQQLDMVITPSSALGRVGLTNLGNTCFMNSCLQCLSNTMLLTQYFLNRYYEKQINLDNPLGSRGRLAKNYAKFIKSMWCSSQSTFSPYSLKSAVAKINPIFSGFAQHDSQQFFSFLVDGIHEDLNRVKKKPYVESVDSKGRQDHVVGLESWVAHTRRNQSIVVDLMTGQYKSKVVCPVCSLESITFDPFTTISLPIPEQSNPGTLKYFVIFNNSEHEAQRMSFHYGKINLKEWLEKATRLLNRQPSDFVFYILTVFENIYNFETTSKAEIVHKYEVESRNIFLLELDPSQKNLKERVEIVTKLCKKLSYSQKQYDNLWFKRPFFFEKQGTTVLDMYLRIIKYIYRIYIKKLPEDEFTSRMLKERPFKLVMKYKKSISKSYSKVETNFQKQIQLDDDQEKLTDILHRIPVSDYELDARFTKETAKMFEFEKLKAFKDVGGEKSNSKSSNRENSVTLDQCFNVFEEKEQLDHGNEWFCPKCKEHRLASKQMTIYKAPEILILHLKRFKNKGVLKKQKNETYVDFPIILNMRKYLIDPKPMSSYIPELKKENNYIQPSFKAEHKIEECEPEYTLYAISNHYGGLGGGHYTAYAKNNEKWMEFNDSSVRPVSEESIKGSAAYMLFYRRRNSLKIS